MPIPLKEKVKNYDNLLTGKLINFVENPDSLGYADGRWYSPKYDRRYKSGTFDPANFGIGIDRNSNEYVDNGELMFHKDSKGREYLTETEERNVRNHSIANAEKSYAKRLSHAQETLHSNNIPSEIKKAITISAIYNLGQGYVANNLFEDNVLMDAFLNGSDLEYSNQVNRYYEKKRKGDRGIKTNRFIEQLQQEPVTIPNTIQGGGIRAEGGSLNSPKLWDDLSMTERAEMMRVAVNNGITDLPTIRQKYNEFAKGGDTNEERPVIVPFKQKLEVIITPDSEYNEYLNTLPDNQRFTPNDEYDSYMYWKLHGKPRDFKEAYNRDMFHYDHSDNSYHANSIAWGDDGIGYFMKPKTHPTVGYELDWFNKGLVTEEGGHQRPETPEEKLENDKFRKNYMLIDDPVRTNFYRYQPVEKANGGRIHIKPENRGKFTALKERTGHSATWFKQHGTPAQRKMATFALNSRKWKHPDGGPLVIDDYTYYVGSLPAVTVSAPALPAYQDQFTGQWYGIGPGGRKVNKPANFDPSGARVYTSPEAFERARLNRAYADDLNHYSEFGDMVRGLATDLVMAPAGDVVVEPLGLLGSKIYGKIKPVSSKLVKIRKTQPQDIVWDARQMFEDGYNTSYTKEDIDILNSHIPEYRQIEKMSKEDGTWLKMPNGEIWKGDPREWVMMHSKAVEDNFMPEILTHGDSEVAVGGNELSGIDLADKSFWTNTNPHVGGTYGNRVRRFIVPNNTTVKTVADANGRYWRDVLPGVKTDNIVYPHLTDNTIVRVNNVVDRGPNLFNRTSLPEAFPGESVMDYSRRVFIGDDLVLGRRVPRKVLLGNNGNFNLNVNNVFKSILPPSVGTGIYTQYKK